MSEMTSAQEEAAADAMLEGQIEEWCRQRLLDPTEPPSIEDTLTPGMTPLTDSLMRVATDEWQRAEIWFKKKNDGSITAPDVLLIDSVRVGPGDTR